MIGKLRRWQPFNNNKLIFGHYYSVERLARQMCPITKARGIMNFDANSAVHKLLENPSHCTLMIGNKVFLKISPCVATAVVSPTYFLTNW